MSSSASSEARKETTIYISMNVTRHWTRVSKMLSSAPTKVGWKLLTSPAASSKARKETTVQLFIHVKRHWIRICKNIHQRADKGRLEAADVLIGEQRRVLRLEGGPHVPLPRQQASAVERVRCLQCTNM